MLLRQIPVARINLTDYVPPVSALSVLLASNASNSPAESNEDGKLTLTVHICDTKETIIIKANDNNTVDEIIRKVLQKQQRQNPSSKLHFDAPSRYELRMHEGRS